MKRLLYHLSKTDTNLINKCGLKAKIEQRSLGFFVLPTFFFAFASSFYLLLILFGYWDEINGGYYLSRAQYILVFIVATVYSITIGAIDREIVSANSKWAVLFRLPLAIFIGLIIAIPLELKIMENSINQKIHDNVSEKMIPFKEQKDKFIDEINLEIKTLEQKTDDYKTQRDVSRYVIKGEDLGLEGNSLSGEKGKGERYIYAAQDRDHAIQQIALLDKQISDKISYRSQRMKELEGDFQIYKTSAVYDLWARYKVMHQIVDEDKTQLSRNMIWGITFFFILLELIPSIIKMLAPNNEYDLRLEYKYKKKKQKFKKKLNSISDWELHNERVNAMSA